MPGSDESVDQLAVAGPLTGAEILYALQGVDDVQTTTQDVANLGGGTVTVRNQFGESEPMANALDVDGTLTGRNSIQILTEDLLFDGGTVTFTFDGSEETDPLDWNAAVETVIAALEGLSTIGAGNIKFSPQLGYGLVTLDRNDSAHGNRYQGDVTINLGLCVEFIGDLAGLDVPLIEVGTSTLTVNGKTPSVPLASTVLAGIATWTANAEQGVAWGSEDVNSNFDIVSFVKRPSDGSVWASEYGGVGSGLQTGAVEPNWAGFNPLAPTVGVTDNDYVWFPVNASFPTIGSWSAVSPITPTRLIEAEGFVWASFPNYQGNTGLTEPTWLTAVPPGVTVPLSDYIGDGDGYWWPVGSTTSLVLTGMTITSYLDGGAGARVARQLYDDDTGTVRLILALIGDGNGNFESVEEGYTGDGNNFYRTIRRTVTGGASGFSSNHATSQVNIYNALNTNLTRHSQDSAGFIWEVPGANDGDDGSTEVFSIASYGDGVMKIGFYNTVEDSQPVVTGSTGGNAALQSLLSELERIGLIVDNSS